MRKLVRKTTFIPKEQTKVRMCRLLKVRNVEEGMRFFKYVPNQGVICTKTRNGKKVEGSCHSMMEMLAFYDYPGHKKVKMASDS